MMRNVRQVALATVAAALVLTAGTAALAADAVGLPQGVAVAPWDKIAFDPAIPTLKSTLGYDFGEEIATHADTRRYAEVLAASAPDRVKLIELGRSWEGRSLFYLVITSPANMAKLEEHRMAMQALSDPRRTDAGRAKALIDGGLPAPVWLAYAVHGNEVSGADSALLTAYRLLAAKGDPTTDTMLANTIVLINPIQNPDGRDRFIAMTRGARGLVADAHPLSAERDEPWPNGRFNHYLFDMNRDWFARTQPETKAQTTELLRWFPVVMADVHEMNTDSTYFFPPAADPRNPFLTDRQDDNRGMIGRNNADWFDRLGEPYFTREVFDLFYPGYGDGWPSYHGTVSMTYEQGSARGLVAQRSDGSLLTFADTVRNQTVASLSAVEVAAKNRARFLNDFYAFRASAVTAGRNAADRYLILPAQGDQGAVDKLAGLLAAQGVEVGRADKVFAACRTTYQPGSYVIDRAQPAYRLIRALMEPRIDMGKEFTAEQEYRRTKGLPDEFYDVTAWALPLLYNVDTATCPAADVATAPVTPEERRPGSITNAGAKLGYLVPWGDAGAIRLLAGALREGVRLRSADEAFTHGGTDYPAGTLIIERAGNAADLTARIKRLAEVTGAKVTGINDSWVTKGPNFGSDKVAVLKAPRVAMAWDEPTDETAAGSARFVLERQFGWPVTVIRTDRLANGDLSDFDVLILPNGRGYGRVLGKNGADALSGWVERGGVLIGLGNAVAWMAEPKNALLSSRREDASPDAVEGAKDKKGEGGGKGGGGKGGGGNGGSGKGDDADSKPTVPGIVLDSESDLRDATTPDEAPPEAVSGVLARTLADPYHWLAAGVKPTVNVMLTGQNIYTPLKLDQGTNVLRFADADTLVASGYLWAENRRQLAFKPAVMAEPKGRGVIIAFATDPTFRGFMDGLNTILANAVFRAPAKTR